MHICDVLPFIRLSHKLFVDKTTSTDKLGPATDALLGSRGQVISGIGQIQIDGVTYQFHPNSAFGVATADGVIVVDFTLYVRTLFMSLLAPSFGQRYEKDPTALADTWRHMTLRFFSGASVGGAICDNGNWRISPHWLPMQTPNPVIVTTSTIEDPISRILNMFTAPGGVTAEDVQKGQKACVDPFFTLLGVGGTTLVTIPSYTFRDITTLDGWEPTLVDPGNDATDVLTRAGTFTPADGGAATWASSAYEDFVSSGFIMASLQLPRVLTQPTMLDRIVPDEAVAGRFWFRSTSKDYAIQGIDQAKLDLLKAHAFDYKCSWLDTLRGVRSRPSTVAATIASPLISIKYGASFKAGLTKPYLDAIPLTLARRAWMRSDPNWPSDLRWLADTASPTITAAWFKESYTPYFTLLKGVTV